MEKSQKDQGNVSVVENCISWLAFTVSFAFCCRHFIKCDIAQTVKSGFVVQKVALC